MHNVGDVYILQQELYMSALEHSRAFILGKYVLLGYINIINQKKVLREKKQSCVYIQE